MLSSFLNKRFNAIPDEAAVAFLLSASEHLDELSKDSWEINLILNLTETGKKRLIFVPGVYNYREKGIQRYEHDIPNYQEITNHLLPFLWGLSNQNSEAKKAMDDGFNTINYHSEQNNKIKVTIFKDYHWRIQFTKT